MLVFLATRAMAQQVPDGDLEVGTLDGWTDTSTIVEYVGGGQYATTSSGEEATLQSAPARGSWSLKVAPAFTLYPGTMDDPRLTIDVRSGSFVVTRHELRYARRFDGLSPSVTLVDAVTGAALPTTEAAGDASSDRFTNRVVDVSGNCGETARAKVGLVSYPLGLPSASYDDFALSGALCAQFADGDGDGLCPEGHDLDGDGDCEDTDELSVGVPVDCDDGSSAVGACLKLEATPTWIQVHEPFEVAVSGAAPGERVLLVGSLTPGPTCAPPIAGNLCLDVGPDAVVLDRRRADPDGNVVFTVTHPPAPTPYGTAILQAVAARPGASIASGSVRIPIRPRPGPFAPGVANGGFEAGSSGWTAQSAVYGFDAWYTDPALFPCPGGVADPAVGRGTGSLHTDFHAGWGSALEEVDCTDLAYSRPVRVTREALGWAQLGSGSLRMVDLVTGAAVVPAREARATASDGFTEAVADVAAACGSDVVIELTGAATWWDDVTFDGPACPEYRDPDGDGLCPEGHDSDGDGACVSAGEPDPTPAPQLEPLALPLETFDGSAPGWYANADDFQVVDQTGLFGPWWGGGLYREDGVDGVSAWLVTHPTLGFSVRKEGTGDWRADRLNAYAQVSPVEGGWGTLVNALDQLPSGVVPGIWTRGRIDLTAHCGEWIEQLEFDGFGWAHDQPDWLFVNPDPLAFDDVGFLGDPCPQFVDTNGDAACAEGLDLDGDGDCVSPGEPTPGVIQDPTE